MSNAWNLSDERRIEVEMVSKNKKTAFGLRELLLFCVGYLQKRKDEVNLVDKGKLCTALGIGRQNLNKNLLSLKKVGLLTPEKHQATCGYILTSKGWIVYDKLHEMVVKTPLIPELHRCEGILGNILPSLKDPVNILKVVSCVMKEKELDVTTVYDTEQARRQDSSERFILKQIADIKGIMDMPFELMVDKFTLTGKRSKDILNIDTNESIAETTIFAELMRRRLRNEEAYSIFSEIVRERSGENSAYRIFSVVGMINCKKSLEGNEEALIMTEDFLLTTVHPAHRVMLKKCQADILTYSDLEEALGIYHSCLKALNKLKLPALETAIYNNMGVAYLSRLDWKKAEKSWRKALRIAREHDYVWVEAVTKLNLADAIAHSGKCDRAKKLLAESKKFFESVDDKDGMSGYNFNMALVCIEEGKKELALKYFRKCEEFPLTYKKKREMRRQVMSDRFKVKRWEEPIYLKIVTNP